MNAAENISETPVEAAIIPPTALAAHLAGPTAAYLGVLTSPQFDAAHVETGALLSGAAVHDLGWLRRIAVRGEDRYRWLSGMVTNSVETLPDRSGAYNLVLNAQGRIQGDLNVWKAGEALELDINADQADALLAHFDRFIIMDDVELVPLEGKSALGITGPLAGDILAKFGIPALHEAFTRVSGEVSGIPVQVERCYGTMVPHYALWTSAGNISALWTAVLAAGAIPVGTDALESLRVVEGIPAYGVDIQSRDLVQETAQMRAVSFTKGCYLGQEIVERIRSRGQVHRHLRALEIIPDDAALLPAVGTELRAESGDAKAVGALTSVTKLEVSGAARLFAIGMVRADAEVGNRPLAYAGGTARILHSAPKSLLSESN